MAEEKGKDKGSGDRKHPKIRIEENMPVRTMMYMSHFGTGDPGRVFEALGRHARATMGQGGVGQMAVSFSNPTCVAPAERSTWRLDCGMEVDVNKALSSNALLEDFSLRQIHGGRYAIYTHVGPYENIAGAMNKLLHEWLPAEGLKLRSDPCSIVEVYIDEPDQVPPEKRRTEIQVPIA